MIPVYPVLRQRMREHGVTNGELAAVLGIGRILFQMKMWGFKRWTLTEAVTLCGFFNTPHAEHLFVRNYYKCKNVESQGGNYHL